MNGTIVLRVYTEGSEYCEFRLAYYTPEMKVAYKQMMQAMAEGARAASFRTSLLVETVKEQVL